LFLNTFNPVCLLKTRS